MSGQKNQDKATNLLASRRYNVRMDNNPNEKYLSDGESLSVLLEEGHPPARKLV